MSPLSETEAQPQPTPDRPAKPIPFTKQDEDELMKEGEYLMSMEPNQSLEVSTYENFTSLIRCVILLFSNTIISAKVTQ